MSTKTNRYGVVVRFTPVSTGPLVICGICGDPIRRAVRVSIDDRPEAPAHYFCRPCVRRAARTADFKPKEHVNPVREKKVGPISEYATKEPRP